MVILIFPGPGSKCGTFKYAIFELNVCFGKIFLPMITYLYLQVQV
jgi:hypothetical protein